MTDKDKAVMITINFVVFQGNINNKLPAITGMMNKLKMTGIIYLNLYYYQTLTILN